MTFVQIEGRCYCCRKSGHKSPEYRFKNKLKSEWFINNIQLTQKDNEISTKNNNEAGEMKGTPTYSGNLTITSKSNPKQTEWTNLHLPYAEIRASLQQ